MRADERAEKSRSGPKRGPSPPRPCSRTRVWVCGAVGGMVKGGGRGGWGAEGAGVVMLVGVVGEGDGGRRRGGV